jgi:hypothetical protein
MKRTLGAALILLLAASCLGQQLPIEKFYRIADSVATYPPADRSLFVLCQKKVDRFYVSFLSLKTELKARIAVVTIEPFTEPDSIALTVAFDSYRPSTGKVKTWGYIFDRNGDGKIDYLALLGGAAAFKTADFPEDYPRRNGYFSPKQLEYFVEHCRLIFNHWADDNDDGLIDAVVHVDIDSTRDWVDRHLLVRSKAFNRSFDDAWGFYDSTDETPQPTPFTAASVPYHSLTNMHDAITWKMFDEKSGILQLFNRAARECGLTPDKFIHPEKTE